MRCELPGLGAFRARLGADLDVGLELARDGVDAARIRIRRRVVRDARAIGIAIAIVARTDVATIPIDARAPRIEST